MTTQRSTQVSRVRTVFVMRVFACASCVGALCVTTAFRSTASSDVHVAAIESVRVSASEPRNTQVKRDSITVTVPPLKRVEVKLVMTKGQRAQFAWRADKGEVTYHMHGEDPNQPKMAPFTYGRGESRGEKGELIAQFDGIHGWAFRNLGEHDVHVTVTAWGQFQELKRLSTP